MSSTKVRIGQAEIKELSENVYLITIYGEGYEMYMRGTTEQMEQLCEALSILFSFSK